MSGTLQVEWRWVPVSEDENAERCQRLRELLLRGARRLCPFPRDGYPSRLFLSAKITHKGQGVNWNADGVMIAGRKWWAVSWNPFKNKQPNQDVNQRLLGMVTAHLQAFQ